MVTLTVTNKPNCIVLRFISPVICYLLISLNLGDKMEATIVIFHFSPPDRQTRTFCNTLPESVRLSCSLSFRKHPFPFAHCRFLCHRLHPLQADPQYHRFIQIRVLSHPWHVPDKLFCSRLCSLCRDQRQQARLG